MSQGARATTSPVAGLTLTLGRLPERLRPLLERSRFYDPAKLPKGYMTETTPAGSTSAPTGDSKRKKK